MSLISSLSVLYVSGNAVTSMKQLLLSGCVVRYASLAVMRNLRILITMPYPLRSGTMNDCEDYDSISRCGSNIGVKRSNLTQTRNCSPRNATAVCGSGMDCVDDTRFFWTSWYTLCKCKE